jgi:predicted LPLAT superfamily acyltransferase
MLRSISLANQVKINVVMYTQNAPSINAFFRRLNPEIEMNVISIGTGSVRSVFEIRGCIERGELVAILADRVAIGDRERAHRVPFLGAPAPFPEGPFTLATMLGCPVLVAEGVRRGDARYEVTSQLFYDGKRVPRSERPAVVKQLLEAYAGHLERCCYDDPYQWFNFYDFWESSQATQQM